MKLYVYDHCPYCVKARMIFGLKEVDFGLEYILNDDVETPTSMIGQKLVPILQKDDGSYMPESMDIVDYVDDNFGGTPILKKVDANMDLRYWLSETREYLYKLAMPRWAKSDLEEFKTQSAIDYFVNKKTLMIGDFDEVLGESEELIANANSHLLKLEEIIKFSNGVNGEFISEDDIHLFAALRSLTVVKGINFPSKVYSYVENTAFKSKISIHDPI